MNKGNGKNPKRSKNRKRSGPDIALSKKLSKLLRHRVDENGLRDCLTSDGFVPLARVLTLPQFAGGKFGLEDVQRVVWGNDKPVPLWTQLQRFATCASQRTLTPLHHLQAALRPEARRQGALVNPREPGPLDQGSERRGAVGAA